MDFSSVSVDTVLGKTLRLLLKTLPPNLILPVLQGKLRGQKWIIGSSTHGCWLGSYEQEKQVLFNQKVVPGSVVFDIGAHVGFYTLLASKLVGNSGRVIAFEPLPRNLGYLQRHLALNKVKNVKVIKAAVSDKDGVAWFREGPSSQMGTLASTGDYEVQIVSLDTLHARNEIPAPDFLKMDVEGGELDALQGAETLLTQFHPIIFLATHGANVHTNCCDYLVSLGYKLKPIVGSSIDNTDEIIAYFE